MNPLRSVMDMQNIEVEQRLDQATQPEWFVPTTQHRNLGDQIASSPHAASIVRQVVKLFGGSRIPKHRYFHTIPQAAVDLIGPACQSAAIVRAELLST